MYDKGERYYEDSPAYDATIEDIDMDAVKAYMKRIGYGKSPMEYLQENKGFLTYKDDVPQVSTACILLFGKRPQNFFPRARVRFIKYYGTEEKVGREMNVIKDVTFEGRILNQIQKTIEYLETQVKEHSYLGEDGLFKTDREYPKFEIQEMTVNSVLCKCLHKPYAIRLPAAKCKSSWMMDALLSAMCRLMANRLTRICCSDVSAPAMCGKRATDWGWPSSRPFATCIIGRWNIGLKQGSIAFTCISNLNSHAQ